MMALIRWFSPSLPLRLSSWTAITMERPKPAGRSNLWVQFQRRRNLTGLKWEKRPHGLYWQDQTEVKHGDSRKETWTKIASQGVKKLLDHTLHAHCRYLISSSPSTMRICLMAWQVRAPTGSPQVRPLAPPSWSGQLAWRKSLWHAITHRRN